jgi:hypothetical protein
MLFRSSNDDAFRSMEDQDHFHIEPHDGNLESTAHSQEHGTDDTDCKKALCPSQTQKKASTEKEPHDGNLEK